MVVRHTRDEEESGRQELLPSGAVGRRAPLTAALLTAALAGAVLALLSRPAWPCFLPRLSPASWALANRRRNGNGNG